MTSMVVMVTTAIPDHLRGALSRWMLEPNPGVFVGTLSARVRDQLWDLVEASVGEGAATCIHPTDNEQGFALRTAGRRRRELVDWDGATLVQFNPEDLPRTVIPDGW